MIKNSYSRMVRADGKSVVLGGALSLFPVPENLTHAFARNVAMAIESAEEAAYLQGYRDAQAAMRKAMGAREK